MRTQYIPSTFALGLLALGAVSTASAATLDRIKQAGEIRLGYYADARPFTAGGSGATPEGYTVTLCEKVADQVKAHLQLSDLKHTWVPVTKEVAFDELQRGNVDLLCTPTVATVAHRQVAGYSVPVFAGGVRAVLRADSAAKLREALAGTSPTKPVWRGQPASKVLDGKKVSAMSGSATEQWVKDRLQTLQIGATYVPVADYRDGVQKLINHETDVFFGERSVVLGVLDDQTRPAVVVMDRLFTQEPLGLALARGDDDFRLVVDRALSGYYGSGEFGQTYAKWFGAPDEATKSFFQWSTLSE